MASLTWVNAEHEEWAVTGTFTFADADPAAMTGKGQLTFKNGWLGTESFGRSTFVQVSVIPDQRFEAVVRNLAAQLHQRYGAPDMLAAVEAARGEAEYAAGLCDHPAGTLLAIEREFTEDGVAERIRVIPKTDAGTHARIWSVEEDEG
ncbi:MAG: hypothetical protein CMM60_09020 [Rhodospirillaceae bacterium]|jgi:hypothetical protein|nr:hypothetical protein [Rhodospirillaceae bacterium]|tara:strand:- start:28281 stop:28724 length:444 start_codon:yes stop_codon:yes gene_type:complete